MLTATLITASLLTPLLVIALGVVCLLWRAAALEIRVQERRIRGLRRRLVSYQTELDALSIAPPAAVAALQPDAEPSVPAGWLDDLHNLPTTYDREYPR